MKNTLKLAGAVLALALTSSAFAVPVTGTIQITGDVTFNTSSLLTATSATFPGSPDAVVTSGTGSYSAPGVAGSEVVFSSFTFVAPGAQVVAPLWSFLNTTNGLTYTFNLSSITFITRTTPVPGTDILNIGGLGTVNITGPGSTFDETFANWSFNVTDTSGGTNSTFIFAFNDSNTASGRVPDGGVTAALLGLSLMGLAFGRRFFARA